MSKNKKKNHTARTIIISIIVFAVLLFVGLYVVIQYKNPYILNSQNKKWISENDGKLIDIAVVNNIPVYSNSGLGLVYDYLEYFQEESGLTFNKSSYLKESDYTLNVEYSFQLKNGAEKLNNDELLVFTDNYVAISKNQGIIDLLTDFETKTLGVLEKDQPNISYALTSLKNIKYKSYTDNEALVKGLENGEVNYIILPNVLNLDLTIDKKYYINYYFSDLTKNLVLKLSDNEELNDIIRKTFNYWFENKYVEDYNKTFLTYYISKNDINDKTKADLLSKTYIYGYVENAPYEFSNATKMQGIAIEYINRIIRLSDIDVKYVRYQDVQELKKAIAKGEVDINLDYIEEKNAKYLQTNSTFNEQFIVLSKTDYSVITTLEELKGKNVNMLANNYLNKYILDNTKANVNSKEQLKELKNDGDYIIVDREVYNFNKNDIFKNYHVSGEFYLPTEYSFMINSKDETFFDLFNYIISTNSYYNYLNLAYENFDKSIIADVSFTELYLIILGLILVPLLFIGIIVLTIRSKRRNYIANKEQRKKYIDILTSLKNRNYLNDNIDFWTSAKVYPQTIIVIDINKLKVLNDKLGHEAGDNQIKAVASVLIKTQRDNSEIMRTDGDEFMIYLVGYDEKKIGSYIHKLNRELLSTIPNKQYGISIGYAMITSEQTTIDDAINDSLNMIKKTKGTD